MMQSNFPRRLKPEAYFTCEQSKEWISTLAKCDNVIDCLDASDEVTCFNGNIGICFLNLHVSFTFKIYKKRFKTDNIRDFRSMLFVLHDINY
jgi:hypothetical protein